MILRESLIETREQVAEAYDSLDNARHTDIMLRMLRVYLESQGTDEAYQANLMLGYWLDVIPEALDEVRKLLDKAHATLEAITASPAEGGTDV
jgi:hypothetical protein